MFWATDNIYCNADGNRLNLNRHEGRLNCDNWNWNEDRNPNIAVFAVMVQEIAETPNLFGCLLYLFIVLIGGNTLYPFTQHASCCHKFLG